MPIANNADNYLVGSQQVDRIYQGANIVWENWSPLDLFTGGVQGAWYDPSDLSTLFQDSAGTTPVTAPGQPVGRMLDKSGNGNHMVQSSALRRPLYNLDGNGFACLVFDGIDDAMVSAAVVPMSASSQVFGSWGIFKALDNETRIVIEASIMWNSNNGSFVFTSPSSGGANKFSFGMRIKTSSQSIINSTTYNAPIKVVSTGYAQSGTSNLVHRLNTVEVQNTSFSFGAGNLENHIWYLGNRNQTTLYMNGNLYGGIVTGLIPSIGDIERTEAYINSKTGAY